MVLAAGVGLNVTGVVPIPGGPVGAGSTVPDGQFTLTILPGPRGTDHATVYTTLFLDSTWRIGPRLLSVTPLGANPASSVTIVGTEPIGESGILSIGASWDPGPGWSSPGPVAGAVIPERGNVRHLLVLVGISATRPADASIRGFQIDYAIGPFRFRSVDQTSILVCAETGATSSYPEYCAQ